MKKTPADKRKLSLNVQHDYISLKTPVGTFTLGRYGAKTSGQLANMPGSLEAIDNYIKAEGKKKTRNLGDIMKDLTDPKMMDKLVPGWDNPITVDLIVGGKAKFANVHFSKKYPGEYEVHSLKGKNAYLIMPNGRGGMSPIGIQLFELLKA